MRSLRQLAIDAPRGMIMDREGRPAGERACPGRVGRS